jgi:hypothetical protein
LGVFVELPVRCELLAGARVGPEDGGPQGASAVVSEYDPVHLAREPERHNLLTAPPEGALRGPDDGVPPIVRGGLGPSRARRPDGVGGRSLAESDAVLAHEQGLDGTSTEVQAEQHAA